MAPKTPSTTTQITKVELPAWVDAASQSNYNFAQQVAGRPYTPYKGQTVAGEDPLEKWADKYFADTRGAGLPEQRMANTAYKQASGLFSKAAGGINSMDRAAYTNPFNTEVLDRSLADLERQRQIAIRDNSDAEQRAGAFGGSRHGVTEAILDAEANKNAGDLSAQLRAQGFDTATSAMQSDLDRMLSAGQGKLGVGQGYLSSSDAAQNIRRGNLTGALTLGANRRGIAQSKLDDLKSRFQEKQDYPLEQLNILLSALGMSPYGKTENVQKTESKGSSGSDFATVGAGILSLIPALFALSDRAEKTDIRKVGVDKPTGLTLYSYRYKGDPKTYPKVVGPMAQDVAKKFPHAAIKVGGKLAIRRPMAMMGH